MSLIRFSATDKMVTPDGLPVKIFQDWALAIQAGVPTFKPLFLPDFGSAGNGQRNDTAALQAAINQAIAMGGGTILIPSGIYMLDTVTIPAGSAPVTLLGYGDSTILQRRSTLSASAGMLNIFHSNVTLDSLLIDGGVTVPVGLLYNTDFAGVGANDPMADSLTGNTSIWLHGPASNFTCRNLTVQHTGGYAILLDARASGMITDVSILQSRFQNNRPNLFGVTAGQAIFGSWTGGIFIAGDGRTASPGHVAKRIIVSDCRFLRNTGNTLWMHAIGLDELHEDVQFSNCYFLDCGLDGILVGACTGGTVNDNVFRRIGYICEDDTSDSIPRWLADLNATALDSSGLVKSVVYADNSFLSVNGGNIDADGHGDSTFSGNVCRIPYSDEPEYVEDRIAVSGVANSGSTSYGVNISNTSATPYGASNLNVVGNTFINLRAGAIRVFSARRCFISANSIIAPADSVYPPVALGPIGPAPNQRCYDNRVSGNKIDYAPVAAAPAVFEDDTYSAFLPAEANSVFNNCPITPSGSLATEFQKSPTSGSVHYLETVWFT